MILQKKLSKPLTLSHIKSLTLRAGSQVNAINKRLVQVLWLGVPVFFLFLTLGCGEKGSDSENDVLIRVGDRVATILDFNEAYEISKTAIGSGNEGQSEDQQKAKLRLLNELTVEMVLLERAQEIGVSTTEAELDKAADEIKNDFPAGEFEETLLEFAVSYKTWKNRLKTRLIIEKVIDKELENRVTITPENIAEYYKKNFQGREIEPDTDRTSADINEIIDNRNKPDKKRRGMFTTGILAKFNTHKIILYFNGTDHAGENLDALLKHRTINEPVIIMSDALSRNIPCHVKR